MGALFAIDSSPDHRRIIHNIAEHLVLLFPPAVISCLAHGQDERWRSLSACFALSLGGWYGHIGGLARTGGGLG